MKPKIVIVGAGLGGCYLAAGLVEHFNVTIIELADQKPQLEKRVKDLALPAVTDPHILSGWGGTSQVWHNGLMEIEQLIFEEHWPFSKEVLVPYYEKAYKELSGLPRAYIEKCADVLKRKSIDLGLPESCLSQNLFYPSKRVNAWRFLKLEGKVERINGEVTELILDSVSNIQQATVACGEQELIVGADIFVLAAGGLGSPLILQKLAYSSHLPGLKHAGFNYEDHPSVFVGEVELDKPLHELWNYPVRKSSVNGNMRMPLSFRWKSLSFSMQLRPAAHLWMSPPRTRIKSILSELRNKPFTLRNYWRLFSHCDDVLDILSLKFGLRLPTRHFSLLMVAEQPRSSYRAVWREENGSTIFRRWDIDKDYVNTANEAIAHILNSIRCIVKHKNLFKNWPEQIASSSHHSGTARMSSSPEYGVCDMNGKVHGVSNLYVCDGSTIPGTGFANTGLTIVALSLRMADYLIAGASQNDVKADSSTRCNVD